MFSLKMNDTLVVPAFLHDVDSAVPAAGTVTFDIYDAAGTAIVSGQTMSHPAGSPTGYYQGSIQLTDGAGFDFNKAYAVVLNSLVATKAGLHGFLFKIESALVPCIDVDYRVPSQNRYAVSFSENGLRISPDAAPTLTVHKWSDASVLVNAQAMTQVGAIGSYKYTESSNLVGEGDAAFISIDATFKGQAVNFPRVCRFNYQS